MRISEDYRNSVGFVLDDDGRPVGTFFLMQAKVAPRSAGIHPAANFMVTARHVVDGIRKPRVRYRGAGSTDSDGPWQGEPPEWDVPIWYSPSDPSIDLAVALYEPSPQAKRVLIPKILPVQYTTPYVNRPIDLGELAYTVGLWPISANSNRGAVPVVRSAVVAAFDEPDIQQEDTDAVWPRAHLIDVRSRGGASGGPVWIQRLVTRPWREGYPLPDVWKQRAGGADTDLSQLGEVATFTDLWGMFVGYADRSGIGVVLPIEEMFSFFDTEMGELMADQKRTKWTDRDGGEAAVPAKAGADDEFEQFRDLTKGLLSVSKDELDEKRKETEG